MKTSKIEWETLRENARRAAVAVHNARKTFLALPEPPYDVHSLEQTEFCMARGALRAARDAWYDAFAALQGAIVGKLDLSYCAGEILDEDEAAEVAAQSPASGDDEYILETPPDQKCLDIATRAIRRAVELGVELGAAESLGDIERIADDGPREAAEAEHEDLLGDAPAPAASVPGDAAVALPEVLDT